MDRLKGKKILTQTLGVKISQCFREFHAIMQLALSIIPWHSNEHPNNSIYLLCKYSDYSRSPKNLFEYSNYSQFKVRVIR